MPEEPRERAAAAATAVRKRCRGPGDLRCGCGSLLARVVAGAVELKCRRCKRIWTVPLEPIPPSPESRSENPEAQGREPGALTASHALAGS